MGGTQTLDYDALAKQHGAVSSQPGQVDYDALAKQHGAVTSTAPSASTATIGVYNPSVSQRLSDFVQPFMEHLRVGGNARDERLLAPEALMTPQQQQAHPMIAGAADVAGGLTSGSNLALMGASGGLGELPGVAGKVIPRVASAMFSAQTLRGAYDELPEFRAAWDRGDWQQAERTGTHILLGAVMAGIGVKHAATGEPLPTTEGPVKNSIYEGYRRTGQYFDKLRQKSVTLNTISESATGLHNSIRQDLITHQEALRNDGSRTIQDAINADKAALMNTNRGSIPTAKVVGEAAKMLDATGYEMKPGERTLFNRILNQPEMTLEEAKLVRTAVGRATFGRSNLAPEAKAVFTTAYNELGEGMKARIRELQWTTRPYEHYNNQFNTSFELEDGIAGEMMKSLQGQDRHAAMPKMEKFADANLDEIQEQMKKIGLDQQSKSLEKAQAHARSLVGAYDVGNGKYMSGIYRLFMQNPREAWPGLAVMVAAHGMRLPFPGPQIAGAIVASGHIGARARGKAARVGQELKDTLPPEYFRTRTQAESPETFNYRDPDQGWTPSGSQPPSSPSTPQPSPEQVAADIAKLKAMRGAKPTGGRLAPDIANWQPPPELGVTNAPDYGQKARADVERRMGGPLKRGQTEQRVEQIKRIKRGR